MSAVVRISVLALLVWRHVIVAIGFWEDYASVCGQTNPQLPLELLGRLFPAKKPMSRVLGPCRRA
jgi:hypothetical protein